MNDGKELYITTCYSSEPYFMKNKDWYYFDKEEWRYKLTDKATKEAIESYNKFYNNYLDEDDNLITR
jgi:hypothetical protein